MKELTLAWAYVRIALRVLRAHKLRSLLTVVSITIGAFSIVLMTSLADGGLQTLIADVEEMGGARLLLVTPDQPDKMKDKAGLSRGYFSDDDRAALMAALPHLRTAAQSETCSSIRKCGQTGTLKVSARCATFSHGVIPPMRATSTCTMEQAQRCRYSRKCCGEYRLSPTATGRVALSDRR